MIGCGVLSNRSVQIIFTRINSILVAKAVLYCNKMRTRRLNSVNMTFDIYYVIMSNRFSGKQIFYKYF